MYKAGRACIFVRTWSIVRLGWRAWKRIDLSPRIVIQHTSAMFFSIMTLSVVSRF